MHHFAHHIFNTRLEWGNIISIGIGMLALIVAVVSIVVARNNQKRNERLTLYQYKLMMFKGKLEGRLHLAEKADAATKASILQGYAKTFEDRAKIYGKMESEFPLDDIK